MSEQAAQLQGARLLLNAALAVERDAFDAVIELADNEADAEKIERATLALDRANESVATLQARITMLEASMG